MDLYIFVFVSLFNLNSCNSTKVQRNNDFNHQPFSVPSSSSNKSNKGDVGLVELLEAPYKLENGEKSYRLIRLSNGLTALLVSTQDYASDENGNNETSTECVAQLRKTSACSLHIDVGSFSDPRDIQGIAHFVEHMVFRGSQKYPTENYFSQFIWKSGGAYHASTDREDTLFEFETHEAFLDEALDRFSQLFKAPLMLKGSMLREREAVESEFALQKMDDGVRYVRMISSLGEKTHPSSLFCYGNSKTLKDNIDDDELHRKAIEFWKRHYSAHRMYLALQSNQSLDTLQEMVMRHFSTIPNNKMPGDDFSAFTHLNAFQPKFYDKIYYVEPIKIGSKLVITWCVEPESKKFEKKSLYIVAYILGYEGKGSLLSYVRKKLWATALSAWDSTTNRLFSMFSIDICLTENGFDHLDDVLAAVFSYLKFIQQAKLNASLFHELRTAFADVKKYSKESDTRDNVKYLAGNMLLYPSKFIVTARNYFYDYDADAVKKTIDYLNLRKFNIMVTMKRSKREQMVYNSTEPWFGIRYTEVDMPVKWIELHRKAEPFPEFTLFGTNPFIADNFTILNTTRESYMHPANFLGNKFCTFWYRPDRKLTRPYAEIYLTFQRPYARSIDNMAQMALMASFLNHYFVEELYPALTVGIQYRCSESGPGILFKVYGFNQKIHLAVDIFGKAMKSLAIGPTEKEFQVFAQKQLEIYERDILDPESLAWELHSSVLQSQYRPLWEKYEHLLLMSFSDFQQTCRSFCEEAEIEALVYGNIYQEQGVEIIKNFFNDFQCTRIENSTLKGNSERSTPNRLPIGAHYLRIKNVNSKDPNSVILNYYHTGGVSKQNSILLKLLQGIAADPVYDVLRNKEQLAYDVSFKMQDDLGAKGYTILVYSQETKFTTDYVDERIENVRLELLSIIERMPLDDFEMFKNALAEHKWVEFGKGMNGFQRIYTSDDLAFDDFNNYVQIVMNVTKAQLLEFYRGHLDPANQRKLSIQVIGNAHAEDRDTNFDDIVESFVTLTYVNFTSEPKGVLIEDLMEFRNSLEEYNIYEEEEFEDDDDDDEDEEEKGFEGIVTNNVNVGTAIHVRPIFYAWVLYSPSYIFY